jgi:hypothetical protein
MIRTAHGAVVAALLVLASPMVSAGPDPGSTCVRGYEPSAVLNVCYESAPNHPGNPGSPPGTYYTGTVTTTSSEVCVIGNLCEDVPMPAYDPNGGVGYPWPGTPGTPGRPGIPEANSLYIEVAGLVSLEFCEPEEEDCGLLVNGGSIVGSYEGENGQTCIWIGRGQSPLDTCEQLDPM